MIDVVWGGGGDRVKKLTFSRGPPSEKRPFPGLNPNHPDNLALKERNYTVYSSCTKCNAGFVRQKRRKKMPPFA
jgi:hypothetical protein